MNYTPDTEPQPERMADLLGHDFAVALAARDKIALRDAVTMLQEEQGPVAEWAEAIGTRLLIRDFIQQQKACLARLHGSRFGDAGIAVRAYLHDMDVQLSAITGHDPDTGEQEAPEALKMRRLHRLNRELRAEDDHAVDLLHYFAAQPTDATVPSDVLAAHLVEIRHGITEWMWPAAASAMEDDHEAASVELQAGIEAVNQRLDLAVHGVMRWDSE